MYAYLFVYNSYDYFKVKGYGDFMWYNIEF